MQIRLRNISYQVDPGTFEFEWSYISSGKWENESFDIFDHFIHKEDIVIDIGAWAGALTLYMAHLAKKVYSLEPDPAIFSSLKRNVELNTDVSSKIKCCQLALADSDEVLTLYARDKYGNSSSSLLPRTRDKLSSVQVQGITLKKFIETEQIQKIDLIKIDIEGGEFDLLPALAVDLQKLNYPTLFVSFHYDYLSENQYLKKIKWRPLSLALMKMEKWFGFDLFKKSNRSVILNTIKDLKDYQYFYLDSGKEINFDKILNDPTIIKKNNLVFTNKKWLKGQ